MRLYLGGYLNFYNRTQGNWIEVALRQPAQLKDIILNQGIPLGEVQLVVVNGKLFNLDTVVLDGDEVQVFSAVGGG